MAPLWREESIFPGFKTPGGEFMTAEFFWVAPLLGRQGVFKRNNKKSKILFVVIYSGSLQKLVRPLAQVGEWGALLKPSHADPSQVPLPMLGGSPKSLLSYLNLAVPCPYHHSPVLGVDS